MKDDDLKSNVDNIALAFDIIFHKDCTDYIDSLNLDIQPDQIDVWFDEDLKKFLDANSEVIENTYYAVQPGFFVPGDDAEETKEEHESFLLAFKKYVQQNQRELKQHFEAWSKLPKICADVLVDNIDLFNVNDTDYILKTVSKPANFNFLSGKIDEAARKEGIRNATDEDIIEGIANASIGGYLDNTAFDDL